jgi:hypothetical protein
MAIGAVGIKLAVFAERQNFPTQSFLRLGP